MVKKVNKKVKIDPLHVTVCLVSIKNDLNL